VLSLAWGKISVDTEWEELRAVAVIPPDSFKLVEPVNSTQRVWYGTPSAPVQARILAQHEAIVGVLVGEGVQIVRLPSHPDLPLQFNIRDPAVVVGDQLICGRMVRAARAQEPSAVAEDLGLSHLRIQTGHLEGGDIIVTPERVYVGLGERTDRAGFDEFALLVSGGRPIEPVFLAEDVLHLDLAMALLSETLGVIHLSALLRGVPKFLSHVEWITVSKAEYDAQAVNVLVIRPGVVLIDERQERLQVELGRRGWRCVKIQLDEISKVGGGVRCITLPLVRSGPKQTDELQGEGV
jgi:N-dimethylarginine dimethylaminohydrolase